MTAVVTSLQLVAWVVLCLTEKLQSTFTICCCCQLYGLCWLHLTQLVWQYSTCEGSQDQSTELPRSDIAESHRPHVARKDAMWLSKVRFVTTVRLAHSLYLIKSLIVNLCNQSVN